MTKRSAFFWIATAMLLATMFVRMLTSAITESQTIDEGAHLAAGYSYWKTGDFRMNPEHPPLLKLITSVPLLFLPIHLPADPSFWENRDQWGFARELLYRNTISADTILLAGRVPVMILTILLGLAIALWSRRLWGSSGGIISLALFSLDPNMIAHGRYVTTDIAMSLMYLLAVLCFGKFLEKPTRTHWILAVLVFGLAQVTKFSAVILWPIFLIVWLIYRYGINPHRSAVPFKKMALFFLSLAGSTLLIATIIYGFEWKTPFSDPELKALYTEQSVWQERTDQDLPGLAGLVVGVTEPESESGAFIRWAFNTIPVPAYTFFRGISHVIWHNYWGHSSYIMGEFGSMGWWYYFPVAFLVKTPFATLILFAMVFSYLVRIGVDRLVGYTPKTQRWIESAKNALRSLDFSYVLLLVPVLVYGAISIGSNLNLGVRHLFPVYPFLFVLSGLLATIHFKGMLERAWKAVLWSLVGILALSSAITHPHYTSYFSELVGGSKNGRLYLTDSNLDWGQELKRLGDYMKDHKIPFVYMTYFGQAPMAYYLSDVRYLPTSSELAAIQSLNGWVAISATVLVSDSPDYAWLRALKPTDSIGDAILLYDLRKPAANPSI